MRILTTLLLALGVASGAWAQQVADPDTAYPVPSTHWQPQQPGVDPTLDPDLSARANPFAYGGSARATNECDDFNRANGPMGGNWTDQVGVQMIASNMGQGLSGQGNAYMLHNTASDFYANAVVSFDLIGATGLNYVAIITGTNGPDQLYTKVQSNAGGMFDYIGFYTGFNGPSYGTGFTAITPITGGRITMYVTNAGDTMNVDIDENYDGIVDYTYSSSGILGMGLSLGSGAGIGTYGTGTYDNWDFNGGCGSGVNELPGMTVPHSFIDFDLVGPAGPTTVAAINAAGTNGGATIGNIILTPTAVIQGVYNTNPNGRALAMLGGGLVLVDPPAGVFDAFNARIDLMQPSTEIGVGIGDWLGSMAFDFYLGGALVASHVSSPYSSTAPVLFFQFPGGFDRVDIYEPMGVGNWVIPELYVEKQLPILTVTNLVAGQNAHVQVSNATPFGLVRSGYSLLGGGPTMTAYGPLFLTPPYTELPAVWADAFGTSNYFGNVPAGTTGITVWMHAMDMGSLTFTNPYMGVIG